MMEEFTSLGDLLDLQAVDLDIDRLLEQRAGLPELAAYRRAHNERERLAAEVAAGREEAKSLRLATDKAEGELQLIEDKKAMEERRMYAGGLSARDLENLVQEVEMLGRKVGTLEEEILGLLDRREESESALAELEGALEAAGSEEQRLEAAITDAWKKIDADIARKEARKRDIVPLIPADLLELYERIRPAKEGVAVGRLAEGICGGCHLRLSAAEQVEVLEDFPPRCLHCRRILVPQ